MTDQDLQLAHLMNELDSLDDVRLMEFQRAVNQKARDVWGQLVVDRRYGKDGNVVVILSETDNGYVVGWDVCWTCKCMVRRCTCVDGPKEPPYVQSWRYAETTPDCRNNMGKPDRDAMSLVPANDLAQKTVDRQDRLDARLTARDIGEPTAVSVKPTPQEMAQRIAAGLAEALDLPPQEQP
jgi:hypothetical protein